MKPFAATDGFFFRGYGVAGTAAAGATTAIDLSVPAVRYLNGVQLIIDTAAPGDVVTFRVVDKDGVYTAAGTVLNEFATAWQLCTDVQTQGTYILPYPAKLLAGLYLRIVYTSVGGSTVAVRANYFLHEQVV